MSSYAQTAPLTIAAASDLAPLETALRQALPSIPLTFTFGSSGMLARQIENGAPFDLFLSANDSFVQALARSGYLQPASITPYATGRLGLWSASGNVKTFKDLTNPSLRHIALPNPRHAPYGAAAEQALRHLGLWTSVSGRLVLGENVRQAFEFARSGNADAVITSWTLVFDKGGVLLPDTGHAPIRQSGGIVRGTPREKEARSLLQFLVSPAGRLLLSRFGLFPPTP
ncbi:MAG: molybdate ABC transporter substrate-binding protein [Acidobacteria bacterium]|nr:molybdate ABC transporter substrate-binding protein [Acidobacteriota bacterium]